VTTTSGQGADDRFRELETRTRELDAARRAMADAIAERQAVETRFVRQQDALIALTNRVGLYGSDLTSTLRHLTEAAAATLEVGRVGIWRYAPDRSGIRCVDLCEAGRGHHSSGQELSAADCPAYFRALADSEVIAVDDAVRDPRTADFAKGYLEPLGIGALLDAPVRLQGVLDGVLCHEHVGEPRHWTADEKAFAVAAANLVALVLEGWNRQQAEAALRDSEERFRLLSRASNDAIWDWDLTTDALWWNEPYETLFGYVRAEEEPSITTWTERVHPADRARVTSSIRGVIEGDGDSWSSEYRFLRRDGSYAYVLDRGEVIRDPAGRPVRMVGGMTDLTERKRAEDRLREQATMLDTASDAILVRDLEHRITYSNRSAQKLYGWSADELLGQRVTDFLYRDPRSFRSAMEAVLVRGEWVGEIEKTSRDGARVTVEGHWTLLRDEDGRPGAVLAIDIDITQRKLLEQQYLRAQRLESIGTLAGGIAHDLNNVLMPIMMSIEVLQQNERDPGRLDMLETIAGSARRGAEMVSRVMSFARGMDGRRVEVALTHVLGDLAKIVRETFPRNVTLELRVSSSLWTLEADPTQLHQVLLNLCLNARDALPLGGLVTITAENVQIDERFQALNIEAPTGPHVKIEVSDTGSGIPKDIIGRIFDPFFTTKEPGQGTGLGLATSLAIVKGHGGFIRVESEPGSGTRIQIYLPAATRRPADIVTGTRSELPRGTGQTVLVVDDEAPIRDIVRRTLEAFGYRVVLAADGGEAVELYEQHGTGIAAVLVDMMMPVLDGPATIQALQRLNPSVITIGVSGLASNDPIARAAGAQHFLLKPFSAEKLLRALHNALTR
jgi:PAS domain S-box-containing protein